MGTGTATTDTVLVTGASAGIGRALAREFAARGHDLVLVARRGELRTAHGRRVEALALDLLGPDAPWRVLAETRSRGLDVGILVNNAGVAEGGRLAESDPRHLARMLQLNVSVLTVLTRLYLDDLLARGRGRILNLSSLAAYQPLPLLAVYAASKAYILSFTEALAEELRGTGVTATALCPGITDTDLAEGAWQAPFGKEGLPPFLVMSPEEVARAGYRACMAGVVTEVPGPANAWAAAVAQWQPRWLARAFWGFVSRQGGR
jgi:short-subunit dehydrogenase